MPLVMSYDSDSSEEGSPKPARKTPNNKAPSLNDTEAFPETLGAGAVAPTVPNGVNFASLAGKFVPEGTAEFDLTQPRPLVRKTITRIARLRELYYHKSRGICNKPLGTEWSLYIDSGLQGPEKSVECDSKLLGQVETTKQLDPLLAPMRQGLSEGSNLRLFKSSFSSPSVLDESLAQGGRWIIAVSKEISRDVFEELCLYVLDERLTNAVDGCLLAVRDAVDVVQIWSKTVPSPDAVTKMSQALASILGLEEGFPVSFQPHSSNKGSKARKYFCVEPLPNGPCVQGQEVSLQPRSKSEVREKKDKKKSKGKKGDEGFITEGVSQRKPRNHSSESSQQTRTENSASASTSNPFGNLEVDDEPVGKKKGPKEEDDVPLVFNKRKKPPSRKGSKKDKVKDEFDDLPVQTGSVVPFPVFMAGGSLIFLVLAFLIWTYTQSS